MIFCFAASFSSEIVVNSNKRVAQSKVVRLMVPNLGETKDEIHPQKAGEDAYCTHIKPATTVFGGSPIILSALE